MVHGDTVEDGVGGEEQTVVEGVLGIQTMREDDMRELEGQDSVEVAHLLRAVRCDYGGGVEQALGDDDGVADSDGLQRLREERAATDGPGEGDVVIGEDIAGESFERLVELAGSIEQACLEEALQYVVLCLLDPGALRSEWAYILRVVADVGGPDDIEVRVGGFRWGNLEDVAPDMIDGLELEGAGDALRIALFNIEGGGQPHIRLHIGAPAIEVIELLVILLATGEIPVEADYVAVASLNPDTSEESSEGAFAVDRSDVKDGGWGIAQKVIADEAEGVVLFIEAVRVHQQHLDETGFVEGEVKAAAQSAEEGGGVFEEATFRGSLGGCGVGGVGVVADDLAELDAAEEVLIRFGDLAEDGIGAHVLDVGLDERSPLLDGLDNFLLAQDGLIDKGTLSRGQLARGKYVLLRLLLAKKRHSCRGRERGGDDGCQQQTGGGEFPENHVFKLLR